MEEILSEINKRAQKKILNEEQKVNDEIKREENNQKRAFLPLQITTKFSFERNKVFKINELSNKRIGILLINSFLIYDLKNFKKLDEIKLPFSNDYYNEGAFDFIELKNSDLAIYSADKILIYRISENKYQPYQTINVLEEKKEKADENEEGYALKNLK